MMTDRLAPKTREPDATAPFLDRSVLSIALASLILSVAGTILLYG